MKISHEDGWMNISIKRGRRIHNFKCYPSRSNKRGPEDDWCVEIPREIFKRHDEWAYYIHKNSYNPTIKSGLVSNKGFRDYDEIIEYIVRFED